MREYERERKRKCMRETRETEEGERGRHCEREIIQGATIVMHIINKYLSNDNYEHNYQNVLVIA